MREVYSPNLSFKPNLFLSLILFEFGLNFLFTSHFDWNQIKLMKHRKLLKPPLNIFLDSSRPIPTERKKHLLIAVHIPSLAGYVQKSKASQWRKMRKKTLNIVNKNLKFAHCRVSILILQKKLLDPSDPAEELALISDSVSRMSPSENNISKLTHPDPRSSPFIGFWRKCHIFFFFSILA